MQNNFLQEEYSSAHVILSAEGGAGALLLGDFNSAVDHELLAQHGIRTIITAADGFAHLEIESSIRHITYPLLDSKTENISAYFEQSHHNIEQALSRGGLLVHCAAGISRSATLVIAYIMRKHRWSFRKAIDFVRKRRACVCPNLGFEMQLKTYEKELTMQATQPSKQLLMHRSKNLMPMQFDIPFGRKQANPQRGASFPSIPHQTRSLLRKKPPTRNGLVSRDRQPERPLQPLSEPQQENNIGSRHSSILKDNLIISSMTGYQNNFQRQEQHQKSRQKHRLMSPPEDLDANQLARNLARMMFGSHMHKWTTSKVVQEHVHNLARARKRLAHLKK